MYFSPAVVAAFAATYVAASPLAVRGNTCGAAPAGPAPRQPIAQPAGILTSLSCQAQCEADNSCQSFCFGLVDAVVQCKLYACAGSAIPKQSSDFVVYDKGCPNVPSVAPTPGNPTGRKIDAGKANSAGDKQGDKQGDKTSGQKNNQGQQNGQTSGQKNNQGQQNGQTSGQQATQSQQNGQASGQQATQSQQSQGGNSNSYGVQRQAVQQKDQKDSGAQKDAGAQKDTPAAQKATPAASKQPAGNTCGAAPAGNTKNQPISTPPVVSEDACKAKCKANTSCKSFTCGKVDSAFVCKLFAVPAAQVPAPDNAAQKKAVKAYDIGC